MKAGGYVPDWYYVPGRGPASSKPLVRIYCGECETYSRPVLAPTAADNRKHGSPLYPDPPKGWEDGCPRCR